MVSRSYRMKIDNGNAPCAFDTLEEIIEVKKGNFNQYKSRLLTLSTCGSKFRHLLSPGEWVFGIAGNEFGRLANKLLWVGEVNEITSKGEYFLRMNTGKEYGRNSRPDSYYGYMEDIGSAKNILRYTEGLDHTRLRKYVIFNNPYHNQLEDIERDLYSNKRKNTPLAITLWFKEWWYFGENAIEIGDKLKDKLIAKGIEAKILKETAVDQFIDWLREEYPKGGIFGPPASLESEINFDIGFGESNSCCSCNPPKINKKFEGSTWGEYLQWWYDNVW